MAEVKILVEGFTKTDNSGENGKTCCTMTLVRDGDLVMVVDPGTLKNQNILSDALEKEGLSVNDVNAVFLTHSHIDHFRNVGMFPSAKVIEFYGEWDGENVIDRIDQLSDDIKIIETPGHASTGLTLLVKTDKGKVAICGDVFWKKDYPKVDDYADDMEKLKESRVKVLEMADYIIPGHAGMYPSKE